MPTVFLNGAFVSGDDARISAFDAAFQHGVGLFETMLAVTGPAGVHVLHLHEHLGRLAVSARALGLTQSLRVHALAEAVDRTARQAAQDLPDTAHLRLRLSLTGGDLNLLAAARSAPPSHDPTLVIVAQPATIYPPEMLSRGVTVTVADWRANPLDPFQGHKTINYWPRLRALQAAAAQRAGESLIFQVTNFLAGGCVSNAFIVRAGRLITPIARGEEDEVARERDASSRAAVAPSPVLPGIVRRWVMDWALGESIDVERRMVTISDVLEADEVFLTNSSWGVLPVTAVEAKPIAAGSVGPVSAQLVNSWKELVDPAREQDET